jgi:hypothetical protein
MKKRIELVPASEEAMLRRPESGCVPAVWPVSPVNDPASLTGGARRIRSGNSFGSSHRIRSRSLFYLVGTSRAKIREYEKQWLELPWQQVRESVQVKDGLADCPESDRLAMKKAVTRKHNTASIRTIDHANFDDSALLNNSQQRSRI